VARRIARVPGRYQPLLKLAAIFGRTLDLALLQQAEPQADLEAWLAAAEYAAVLDVDDGQWRFSHDKLRDYLLQSLTEAERRDLHRRAALAIEQVYPDSPEHIAALAHHWKQAGDRAQEARYVAQAGQQALASGAYQKALALLERALALETLLDGVTAARLRLALGETCYGLGEYDRAQRLLMEATDRFEAQRDAKGIAHSLRLLGNIALALGSYDDARDWLRRGLAIAREAEDQLEAGRLLRALGLVAQTVGDYAEARRCFEESLSILTDTGDQTGMAGALSNLASIAHVDGQFEEARRLYEQALSHFEAVGFTWGVAYTLTSLGETEEALGNLTRARELHQQALTLCREIGHRWGAALALHNLGRACLALEIYGEAHQALAEAFAIAREIQTTPLALAILTTYANLLATAGADVEAGALLVFVMHHPQVEQDTLQTARKFATALQQRLSPPAWQAATERGKSLRLETVEALLFVDQAADAPPN